MEIWKDVPDYEGHYQVSSLGRVKSLKRLSFSGRVLKEKILKPANTNNYKKVVLSKNDNRKQFYIHQLVAMAFLGHSPNGHSLVVDHVDGDTSNNSANNLQIVTQRKNTQKKKGEFLSSYTGVSKQGKKWAAKIKLNGKSVHLGTFECELSASKAYQDKLKTL